MESESVEVPDNNKEITFYILWGHKELWRSLRNRCFKFHYSEGNIFVKWFESPQHIHMIQIIEKISKKIILCQIRKRPSNSKVQTQ